MTALDIKVKWLAKKFNYERLRVVYGVWCVCVCVARQELEYLLGK